MTDNENGEGGRPLIYRQTIATRLTHWLWVACLAFLLGSGLNIFMARPDLYVGQQSGFGFENRVLSIGSTTVDGTTRGVTTVFGKRFDTTGWLGVVERKGERVRQSFPPWLVIPGYRDLATGRIVHFFFAWLLVGTLLLWLVASLANGHARSTLAEPFRHQAPRPVTSPTMPG